MSFDEIDNCSRWDGRDFCSRFLSWQHQKRVALHWNIGAFYRNRYPDMRHTLVASILVVSFASAGGSSAAKVHTRNITHPECTSNASRSCWRNSSIDSNSTSGTLMVLFYLAFHQMLGISLTFTISRPFFATLVGRTPNTTLSISSSLRFCPRVLSRHFSLERQTGQAFLSDSGGSSPLHMWQWADLLVESLRVSST